MAIYFIISDKYEFISFYESENVSNNIDILNECLSYRSNIYVFNSVPYMNPSEISKLLSDYNERNIHSDTYHYLSKFGVVNEVLSIKKVNEYNSKYFASENYKILFNSETLKECSNHKFWSKFIEYNPLYD